MSQIKEKAPAAPASVTSAKPVHIEDTIKNLIRQVEPVNFNLEDLFIWFQQSQDYRNRPQVDKADRKLTNRLITAVGRKTFSEGRSSKHESGTRVPGIYLRLSCCRFFIKLCK